MIGKVITTAKKNGRKVMKIFVNGRQVGKPVSFDPNDSESLDRAAGKIRKQAADKGIELTE